MTPTAKTKDDGKEDDWKNQSWEKVFNEGERLAIEEMLWEEAFDIREIDGDRYIEFNKVTEIILGLAKSHKTELTALKDDYEERLLKQIPTMKSGLKFLEENEKLLKQKDCQISDLKRKLEDAKGLIGFLHLKIFGFVPKDIDKFIESQEKSLKEFIKNQERLKE